MIWYFAPIFVICTSDSSFINPYLVKFKYLQGILSPHILLQELYAQNVKLLSKINPHLMVNHTSF